MNKIIIIIFLIFNRFGLNAQTFECLIQNQFDSYAIDVIQINSSYFVATNNVFESINGFESTKSELLKLDSNGNLLNSLKFDFLNNHVRIKKLIRVDDDIFLHGVNSIAASSFSQKAFIARIDSNLNIKYLQNYFIENVAFSIMDITDYDSTNFLIYYLPGYPYYTALINKYNGSVELKTQKDYPFYSLIHLKNKNIIHLYVFNQFNFPILSLDNLDFNVIDSIYYQSITYAKKCKLIINDSTYFIASEYLKNTPNYPDACWDLSVIKVNDSLNNINSIIYTTYPDTLGHHAANNNAFDFCKNNTNIIYYGGTYNYTIPFSSNFIKQRRRFELLKIDREGNFIDRKIFSYNIENYAVEMYSLSATADGGCIMVGSYWNYNEINPEEKRSIYILKVDSLGNFTPSLGIENVKNNERLISIYPNPNSNRILNITGYKTGEKILVYNLQGQLIKSMQAESKIDISDLSKGVYIFSIQSSEGENIKIEKMIIY
jgi:hypothetical protein